MTVLVTGATGFTGTALISHLRGCGRNDTAGLARTVPEGSGRSSSPRIVPCDLLDLPRLRTVIGDLFPDCVVHLAGLNRGAAHELFRVNVNGTRNLLDAVHAVNPACRVLVVTSSAVYGDAGQGAIGEESPVRPVGEYGESKAGQEEAALAHRAAHGTRIAIARPFNLVGPGQPDSFVCGRIVKQAVEIERGEREALALLETRSCRDFIDVRDAVRAYWALVSHPDFEHACAGRAFNICSGTVSSVSGVISLVGEITGRMYAVRLPETPAAVPVPFQQGDRSRIQRVTGWKPAISLRESLSDMLETARQGEAGRGGSC